MLLCSPGLGLLQATLQNGLAQPATPMGGCKPDLVDPQLRRLIRVDVVDSRGKADYQPVVDSNRDMMPSFSKKFPD